MHWDLDRLRSLTRDFPWLRTASADAHGPRFDGFALFNYTPVNVARGNNDLQYINSLIIEFKKNDPAARAAVIAVAKPAIEQLIWSGLWKSREIPLPSTHEGEKWALTADWFVRDLIVIPGHTAGVGKPATNDLASNLGKVLFDYLDPDHPFYYPSEFVLDRHTAQAPSHIEKKSVQDHLRTISLRTIKLGAVAEKGSASGRYMLLDDVYTRGATFGACKQLLVEQNPSSDVMGFFVAVTAY